MVCFRKDLKISNFSFPKPISLQHHLEDFLLTDEKAVHMLYAERNDIYWNNIVDNKYENKPIRLGIVNKGGQGERIYSTKGVAITLSAYGGGVFL